MLLDEHTAIYAHHLAVGEYLGKGLDGLGVVNRLMVGRAKHCVVHDEEVGVCGRQAVALFVVDGIGHGQPHKFVRLAIAGSEGLKFLFHQVQFFVMLVVLVLARHVCNGVAVAEPGKGVDMPVGVITSQITVVEP